MSTWRVTKEKRKGKHTGRFIAGAHHPEQGQLRRYFHTKLEADNFAKEKNDETRNIGWAVSHLTDDEKQEASKCLERLKAKGKTLTEAVDHFLTYIELTEKSVTVSKLWPELVEAKRSKGLSPVHLRNLTYHFRAFAGGFGKRIIATITRAEIEKWLHKAHPNPASYKAAKTHVGMLFIFAVKEGYGHTNPVKDIELPKAKSHKIEVLTVPAVRRLLTLCKDTHPDIIPSIAIQLFAGLRREEVLKLDWKEVRLERGHIEVTGENAKSSERRIVPISDNLKDWLTPHMKTEGSVTPSCYAPCSTELRRALETEKHKWGKNALRHSFASYRLAETQDASKTALELGHRGSDVLFKHYREAVTKQDASDYFGILPSSDSSSNIIEMAKSTPSPATKRLKSVGK